MRHLTVKRYPDKISNQKLYKRCEERSFSIDILKGRWTLLGHILRRFNKTPAVFDRPEKGFRGRLQGTTLTTLNKERIQWKEIFRYQLWGEG